MKAKKKVVTFKRKVSGKPAKDYMKTIERLIFILNKLNTHKSISSSELSKELGVNMRTIQRDIALLAGFYPIFSPERGRHAFMAGFNLGKVELSDEQGSLLSFMHNIAASLGDKFELSFRDLFKRVITPQVDTPFYAKIPTGTFLPESPYLKIIQDAIRDCDRLTIHYCRGDGEKKDYQIEPLRLAFYDGFWYLLSQGPEQNKIRKFRLDRILKATETGKSFIPMDGFEKLLDESVNVWFDVERPERTLIRVAPEAVQYFKKRKYFPLQKTVEEKPDGSLIIETYPAHPEEISHTIMNWIPCLTVVEPAVLKIKVKKIVSDYAEIL